MPEPQMHSTGRGGTGNIGKDDTPYTDASIVREGPLGKSAAADAEYSTGRGGAGNIDHHHHAGPHGGVRTDTEYIPEQSVHEAYPNYHTGRGGQGNVHKDKYGGHSSAKEEAHANESLAERAKGLLGLGKKEEKK